MKERKFGYSVDRYFIEQIIEARLRKHDISAIVDGGSSIRIIFNTNNHAVVQEVMQKVLKINTYETQVENPVPASRVKAMIGVNENTPVPLIDEHIVKHQRISVDFSNNLLKPLLEEELEIELTDVKAENYYECRDGDVSSTYLFTDKEIPLEEDIHCKSGAAIYIQQQGFYNAFTEEDFSKALEKHLKGIESFILFTEKGPIEFFTDTLVICIEDDVSKEEVEKSFEPFFEGKQSCEHLHYMFERQDTEEDDIPFYPTKIEGFYRYEGNTESIPKEYQKDYKFIIAIYMVDIVPFLEKHFNTSFDKYCFLEGECYVLESKKTSV